MKICWVFFACCLFAVSGAKADQLQAPQEGVDPSRREAQAVPEPPPETASETDAVVPKPAWLWTIEERLEVRFDPEDRRRRLEVSAADHGNPRPKAADPRILVDGNRNPELFLPQELFMSLIRLVLTNPNPENRETFTYLILERARKHKLDLGDNFLRVLAQIASKVIEREQQGQDIRSRKAGSPEEQKEIDDAWEAGSREACAERKRALDEARAVFGAEDFDRFLYLALTPGKFSVTILPELKDNLRWIEEGCP